MGYRNTNLGELIMFTINLNQNVINELFAFHTNPEPELSNETIAVLDQIELDHGSNWLPVSALDGELTFEYL